MPVKKFKEVVLKVDQPTLDDVGRMLYLRKMTGNDIGADYEFAVLIFKGMMGMEKEIMLVKTKKGIKVKLERKDL